MKTRAHKVLADILESGIDVHRCAAARAFATIGGDGAVEVLIPALLDEDPDVRTDAAQSLAALGDTRAAGQLMENLLGDPEPDVKKAALGALIAFGHEPVVPLLRQLAVSRTDQISWDDDEFYNEGWDSWLDLQLIAIRGLAEFATEDAVQDILTAMGDEQGQDVSGVAIAALANMGVDGAEALRQLFPISDTRLQRQIAREVMRTDNPHVKGMIDGFLTDESPQIREIAALGLDPGDARIEALFGDPDAMVRASVVQHSGRNFDNRIKEMITDPDPKVRAGVFKVIAAAPEVYRDEKLVGALKKAIGGDAGAAKQAALALIALEGAGAVRGLTHVMSNKKVPLDFRVGAVEALELAGPDSAPYLLKGAADEERRLRLAAMTALAGLAANDPVWPNLAGEGLLGALGGNLIIAPQEDEEAPEPTDGSADDAAEEPGSRSAQTPDAPLQDGEMTDPEVDNSTPLVSVPDVAPDVAPGSTLGLIMAGGPPGGDGDPDKAPDPVDLSEQEERFLELSKQRRMSKRKMSLDSDVAPYLDVRRFAASVLGEVPNPQVTRALIGVLGDEDGDLAREALNSLVQHGETMGSLPQSAQEPLIEIFGLADSDSTRVPALRAIARLSAGGEQVLRDALGDPDPHVRVEAVRGLDNMGIAGPETEAALNDDYIGVALAAARSLARHRGEAAVDLLIEFAFRNDGTHRRDVGRMLADCAPEAGTERLIELATDEAHLRERLVVIDALAVLIGATARDEDLKVA